MTNEYVCYVIRLSGGKRTYCGVTNNLKRRLRQHNGEISGGARYTTTHGPGWSVYFVVRGFVSHRDCLRFEWKMKHTRVNGMSSLSPCARRDCVLQRVLASKPLPYNLEVARAV